MSIRFVLSVCFTILAVTAFSGFASAHPGGNPHVHKPYQPQGETPLIERSVEDAKGR